MSTPQLPSNPPRKIWTECDDDLLPFMADLLAAAVAAEMLETTRIYLQQSIAPDPWTVAGIPAEVASAAKFAATRLASPPLISSPKIGGVASTRA